MSGSVIAVGPDRRTADHRGSPEGGGAWGFEEEEVVVQVVVVVVEKEELVLRGTVSVAVELKLMDWRSSAMARLYGGGGGCWWWFC